MSVFPCTKCGACCSSIDGIDFLDEFNNNGICIYLQNNVCTIYEKRPILCRIDEAYDRVFYRYMTREEFFRINAYACNKIQEEKGISLKYRVHL